MKLLLVLVTNDDGAESASTRMLARRLADEGFEVFMALPRGNWSGSSKSIGYPRTVGVEIVDAGIRGVEAYVIEAPPAAIVAMSIDVLGVEPDIVVSGVNYGPNLGVYDVLTSGTIGAAIEAGLRGVLGVGLSSHCGGGDAECIRRAVDASVEIVKALSRIPSRPFNALSVNVPRPPWRGVKPSMPSPGTPRMRGSYSISGSRGSARIYSRVHEEAHSGEEEYYDGGAFFKGYITITPILVGPRGLSFPLEESASILGELASTVSKAPGLPFKAV